MGVIVKDKLRWNFPREETKGLRSGLYLLQLLSGRAIEG
jgi:hypothetical protein